MTSSFKMLPGHEFTIESDATLTATSIHIYSQFNDVMAIAPKYDSGLPGAKFVLRGGLTATSVGGNIYSDTNGANINVTNTSVTTSEMETLTSKFFGLMTDSTIQNITDSLKLYSASDINLAISNNSSESYVVPSGSTKYKMVDGLWVVA